MRLGGDGRFHFDGLAHGTYELTVRIEKDGRLYEGATRADAGDDKLEKAASQAGRRAEDRAEERHEPSLRRVPRPGLPA